MLNRRKLFDLDLQNDDDYYGEGAAAGDDLFEGVLEEKQGAADAGGEEDDLFEGVLEEKPTYTPPPAAAKLLKAQSDYYQNENQGGSEYKSEDYDSQEEVEASLQNQTH